MAWIIDPLNQPTTQQVVDYLCHVLAACLVKPRQLWNRQWTPVHLDFVVEEIETAVQEAISAGARLEKPVATHTWGKLALMADPFGHGFCFVQFLGRGYDEIAT